MAKVGLEPTRRLPPGVFKTPASTVPPLGQKDKIIHLQVSADCFRPTHLHPGWLSCPCYIGFHLFFSGQDRIWTYGVTRMGTDLQSVCFNRLHTCPKLSLVYESSNFSVGYHLCVLKCFPHCHTKSYQLDSRTCRIRTCDSTAPNGVLYQAELMSVSKWWMSVLKGHTIIAHHFLKKMVSKSQTYSWTWGILPSRPVS